MDQLIHKFIRSKFLACHKQTDILLRKCHRHSSKRILRRFGKKAHLTVLFLLSVLAGCKRNNIISDWIISGFLPDLIRLRFILYDLKMLLGLILRRIHFEPAEQILKLQTLT